MLTKEELPECPVAKFFQIVGNKWKIYILQKLFEKPCRFNELKNLIPGIGAKVLSESLRYVNKYSSRTPRNINSIFNFSSHAICLSVQFPSVNTNP